MCVSDFNLVKLIKTRDFNIFYTSIIPISVRVSENEADDSVRSSLKKNIQLQAPGGRFRSLGAVDDDTDDKNFGIRIYDLT